MKLNKILYTSLIFATTLMTLANQDCFAAGQVKASRIPAGIIETSKATGLWQDIYTSPKKVILYSYQPGSTCPYQSQEFHNKMSSAASQSGGQYFARPTGPDKLTREVNAATARMQTKIKQAKQSTDPNAIKKINKEISDFNKLISFTNKCTVKACIINPSKGEYIMMNRDSAQALNTIKNY